MHFSVAGSYDVTKTNRVYSTTPGIACAIDLNGSAAFRVEAIDATEARAKVFAAVPQFEGQISTVVSDNLEITLFGKKGNIER